VVWGLIVFAAVGTYTLLTGVLYRRQWIKTQTAWRRWQAEQPNKVEHLVHEWGDLRHARRSTVSYASYLVAFSDDIPPSKMAQVWPLYGPLRLVDALLHPEVKLPDYEALKTLEKGTLNSLEKEIEAELKRKLPEDG
jgi:hypothetical protein